MKLEFVKQTPDSTRLILVFAGWSAGREAADGINMPGWDVAVAYDFSELALDCSFLDRYYTVYLFAWSLGVVAAERLLPPERITAAFAVNGTPEPVSDTHGIPPAIYNGTLSGLDERTFKKFRLRMAGDKETYASMGDSPFDDIPNLQLQLSNIAEAAESNNNNMNESVANIPTTSEGMPWVRAFISRNDRIFPPENTLRYWKTRPDVEIVELDAAHYVPLHKVVGMAISNPEKVSQKFCKASVSYDTHAIAQYTAAIKLTSRLMDNNPVKDGKVLEIGCGTGLFTREYSPKLSPASITFVDITTTGPFGVAPDERYVVEDAERWIEKSDEKWDVIVSASAIQWFADIPRFLHLCHGRLNPGGVLAISTFTPGNLEELDTLRPSPLLYPKAENLRRWLERDFSNVAVEEDEIKVEFRSVREMLMHLKHTGVGGSAPGSGLKISDMAHLRTLTYRPVYITATK